MRCMVIVKASKESEAGMLPSTEILQKMGKFNEELVKNGVMLAGEGLQPTSNGKRVKFEGEKRTVIDGPFAETKELIGGLAILRADSREHAVELAKFFLGHAEDGECELRQLYEANCAEHNASAATTVKA